MEYQVAACNLPKDRFLRAYLEAAEWAGLQEDEREALELSVAPKWDTASIARAQEDCDGFREHAGAMLGEWTDEEAGHDFYLSRNGHGAGFFDRGRETGNALQDLAQQWGSTQEEFDVEEEGLSTR